MVEAWTLAPRSLVNDQQTFTLDGGETCHWQCHTHPSTHPSAPKDLHISLASGCVNVDQSVGNTEEISASKKDNEGFFAFNKKRHSSCDSCHVLLLRLEDNIDFDCESVS